MGVRVDADQYRLPLSAENIGLRLWLKQILNTVITDHGHIKVGLK